MKYAKWQCPYCGSDVGYLGNWLAKLFGTRIHNCQEIQFMSNLTPAQKRVLKVLERIKEQVEAEPDDAEIYADEFEVMLDDLLSQDFFGTEGQCDPRGDMRSGAWSLENDVQGVDD